MNELLASIVLMCSPQENKPVFRACVVWMKRCIREEKALGRTDEQADEICSESLPLELENTRWGTDND